MFRFNRITDSAISDQFNQVGYQNKSLSINNLNSLYIFFTFGPAMCFVFWFLFKFNLLRRFPHIQDRIDRVVHKVLWNGILLFCSETYVVVCTVASIGIKDLRLGAGYSNTEKNCSFVSIGLILYVASLPIITTVLYLVKFKSVNPVSYNRDMVRQFGDEYIEKIEKQAYT